MRWLSGLRESSLQETCEPVMKHPPLGSTLTELGYLIFFTFLVTDVALWQYSDNIYKPKSFQVLCHQRVTKQLFFNPPLTIF